MEPVYLDHAATTPLSPVALEAMQPFLTSAFGNPSSPHAAGRRARHAVDDARRRVAKALGARPDDVVFTAGGTESDNAAIAGLARDREGAVITSATEHEAVLQAVRRMSAGGREVVVLDPEADGTVSVEAFRRMLDRPAAVASFMLVNNETGALNPVRALADAARGRSVMMHCDAVQAPAVLPLDVQALGVDALSLSAHKIHGPKGVGALWVRGGVPFEPFLAGGAQEQGRRGGTENVAGIVGFAAALEEAVGRRADVARKTGRLRGRLLSALRDGLGDAFVVNGPMETAPHILSVAFPPGSKGPLDGEMLLMGLDLEGVQVSAGSACTSGAVRPSHVLRAMGLLEDTARAAIRFSLGRDSTEDGVDRAAAAVISVARRQLNP